MASLLAALAGLALVLAGCGEGREGEERLAEEDAVTGHVHAVGVDPADGATYLAAHTGLFRAARGARRASRVGDERRDVMGFSVVGPGQFAGSGHPDVRQGGPTSVGYIRSGDAGRSWRTVSLAGEADFHALEVVGDRVYGFDALTGALRVSVDAGRTWAGTKVPPMLDIAVDPEDPETIVGSTEEGIVRSTDGGRSFETLARIAPSHLVWPAGSLLAITLDGDVVRVAGRVPRRIGRVPLSPSAAGTSGRTVLVAAHDGSVVASSDGGRTWRPHLAATTP